MAKSNQNLMNTIEALKGRVSVKLQPKYGSRSRLNRNNNYYKLLCTAYRRKTQNCCRSKRYTVCARNR